MFEPKEPLSRWSSGRAIKTEGMATVTFAVLYWDSGGTRKVMTLLTDIFDADFRADLTHGLSTYDEAVSAVTKRALAREAMSGFIPGIGAVKFVPVCERIVLGAMDGFDALVQAIH